MVVFGTYHDWLKIQQPIMISSLVRLVDVQDLSWLVENSTTNYDKFSGATSGFRDLSWLVETSTTNYDKFSDATSGATGLIMIGWKFPDQLW